MAGTELFHWTEAHDERSFEKYTRGCPGYTCSRHCRPPQMCHGRGPSPEQSGCWNHALEPPQLESLIRKGQSGAQTRADSMEESKGASAAAKSPVPLEELHESDRTEQCAPEPEPLGEGQETPAEG